MYKALEGYQCPDIDEISVYSSPFGGSHNFVASVDYCINVDPDDPFCKSQAEVDAILTNIGINGMVFNSFFSPELYYSERQKVAGFEQSLTSRLRPGYSVEQSYKVVKTDNLFYGSVWFDFSVQEEIFVHKVETFSMVSNGIYQFLATPLNKIQNAENFPVQPLFWARLSQSQENIEIKWIRRSYEEVTAMVGGTTAALWFMISRICMMTQDTYFKKSVLSELYTTDVHDEFKIEVDEELDEEGKNDPTGKSKMLVTLDNRQAVDESLLDQKLAMHPCVKPCKSCIDPKRISNNKTINMAMERFEDELDLFEIVKLNRKSKFIIDLYMKENQQRLINDFSEYYIPRNMDDSEEEEEEEEEQEKRKFRNLPTFLDVKTVLKDFNMSTSDVDKLIYEKVHEFET